VWRFPAFKAPSQKPDLYRGAFHVHSEFSHDSKASLERIIDAAERASLDFVVVTDHNTLAGAEAYRKMNAPDRPLLIFGNEISTSDGHLIALGINEEPPDFEDTQQLVYWIKQRGGYVVLAHPTSIQKPWNRHEIKDIDGIEIFSFPDVYYEKEAEENVKELGLKAAFFFPAHFINSVIRTPRDALALWNKQHRSRHVSIFGSVDAHLRWEWRGLAPENYLLYLQSVTTYVSTQGLSPKSIIDALAAGNSFIAHETRGMAQDFSFSANLEDKSYGPGATVPAMLPIKFAVKTPDYAEIQLLKNGEVVKRVNGDKLEMNATGPGVYRVEAYALGELWIASNPIYVE
jgi:hypothetical protein